MDMRFEAARTSGRCLGAMGRDGVAVHRLLKSREFGRIAFKRLKIFNAFKDPCAKLY
jgi:hypothetical protein